MPSVAAFLGERRSDRTSFFVPQTREIREASYVYIDTSYQRSLSLSLWKKITNWRAEKKGSSTRKVLASVGYFFNGIFAITETTTRFAGYYIIGNSMSGYIAKSIGFVRQLNGSDYYFDSRHNYLEGKTMRSYNELKQSCHKSFSECKQSIVQNGTSTATNLISQNQNIRTAKKIADLMKHDENKGDMFLKICESVSPDTIVRIPFNPTRAAIQINRQMTVSRIFE